MPSWVAPDPTREVAIDALGLSWQADQLADKLLPDLSVLTRRARYLSFLAWSISKSISKVDKESNIHKFEVDLAFNEAKRHDRDSQTCLGIIGRFRALDYIKKGRKKPIHPETLYKSTAFRAYRPLLRAAGLLEMRSLTLTPSGEEVASAYGRASHGRPACMSEISTEEKKLLKRALGFDGRVNTNMQGQRRRETYKELLNRFDRFGNERFHPAKVLPVYSIKPKTNNPVRMILHMAYVWEVLSLGFNLAFVCILRDMRLGSFEKRLKEALQGRPTVPELSEDFTAQDNNAARHVVALLRHACSLQPSILGLQTNIEDLARILVRNCNPEYFLKNLLARHESVKGIEAWVQHTGENGYLRRQAPPRKGLPDHADLHPYRLSAFYELGEDLDLWP